MVDSDLTMLLSARSEALEVEYKAWMDLSKAQERVKIARHLAALANHGGGYLVFGIDDKTKLPQGATELPASLFQEDSISSIVKAYLDPRFQCRTELVSLEGVQYPVVIVPSHGARPVIAIADGPQDERKRPIGLRQGTIYIRSAGPESEPIRRSEDWTALLERCLSHRVDLLSTIMRQAIARPVNAVPQVSQKLRAACAAISEDFSKQVAAKANVAEGKTRELIRDQADKFVILGYALISETGELRSIEDTRSIVGRADVGMHNYAYDGWNAFLPLHVPDRAPQLRTSTLMDEEAIYLEGMRVENNEHYFSYFDYWRVYEAGIACIAETYWEDARFIDGKAKQRSLDVDTCLVRLHSIVAHARLVGQELPGVARVMFYMNWTGLSGRVMTSDHHRTLGFVPLKDDRFAKAITIEWSVIRDDYFAALQKLMLPFFDLFAAPGSFKPSELFTREWVAQRFSARDARMRLFD